MFFILKNKSPLHYISLSFGGVGLKIFTSLHQNLVVQNCLNFNSVLVLFTLFLSSGFSDKICHLLILFFLLFYNFYNPGGSRRIRRISLIIYKTQKEKKISFDHWILFTFLKGSYRLRQLNFYFIYFNKKNTNLLFFFFIMFILFFLFFTMKRRN